MLFFYNIIGDIIMKVYVDLILFINFGFDFLLLLSVSIILRRKVMIYRLLLGAFFGSITTLTLFLNITSLELFIIKVVISFFMVFISFGFRSFKYTLKNIIFLYITSIVLGGGLYLLNIEFSYNNRGIIFYHNGMSLNFIILVILSPIIIYIYTRESKSLRNNYSNYHRVEFSIQDRVYNYTGFLDTGNKLRDPYKNRPVILVNNSFFKNEDFLKIMVPASTIIGTKLIECIKIDNLRIDDRLIHQEVLLGLIDKKINIDGIDCLLHYQILEG